MRAKKWIALAATMLALAPSCSSPTNLGGLSGGGDGSGTSFIAVGGATTSVTGTGGGKSGSTGSGGAPTTTTTTTQASTSTTTTTQAASTSSGGNVPNNLASVCTSDVDCTGGLTCIKATDTNAVFSGGPANGYCSTACKADADCPGMASACYLPFKNQAGTCVATCIIGDPTPLTHLDDKLDPSKCWGRDDLRCAALAAQVDACIPSCGNDSQCPAGRFCDPRTNVCVDKKTAGDPAGATCDPKAMVPTCAGVCLNATSASECSTACVVGVSVSLANTPNCGGLNKGLCAYTPMGVAPGDTGFCTPACSKHDECQNPTWWCNGIGIKGMSNGYCFNGNVPCPGGQSDCMKMLGVAVACTQTKYGPMCLDPAFPLGSAAP